MVIPWVGFELGKFLTVAGQLVEQLVAGVFLGCVAQQTPQLMLALGQRDKAGDVVAVSPAGGVTSAVPCHPFNELGCGVRALSATLVAS